MKKITAVALSIGLMLSLNMTSFAADAYSPYWEIDSNQVWHYKMADVTYATDSWIHDEVNGDWYLLDVNGDMLSGVFCSYGKYYYLDTVRGTGHYGRLLKNGQTVNGVTIKASINAEDEGALSQETLNALKSSGINTTATEISGTKHVSGGVVTSEGNSSGSNSSGTTKHQYGRMLTWDDVSDDASDAVMTDEEMQESLDRYDRVFGGTDWNEELKNVEFY